MAPDWLAGAEYLLNTDGFHLGRAVVGSASGRRETWAPPWTPGRPPASPAWRLTLSGGRGGHSGDDINRGRANAVQAAGRLFLAGLPGGRIASSPGPDPQRHPRPGRGSGILPRGARASPPCGAPADYRAAGSPPDPATPRRPGPGRSSRSASRPAWP